jgi:hypothetical protein
MISHLPAIFRWLAVAALTDWLIARTLTRTAIHMPKPPFMIAAYQGANLIGQLAVTLTALLGLLALGWIAWHEWRARRAVLLPLALSGLAALSLAFLVITPSSWLAMSSHALSLTAVILLMGRMLTRELRASALFPAAAVLISIVYQFGPTLYEALQWPGPPPFSDMLFNLGELLVVISAIALWKAHGHGASGRDWLAASVPMAIFIIAYLASPAMTGIMAVWSIGLTLYLPWPLYALSLWLAGVTVIVAFRRNDAAGLAIVLLAAGGYAPQLSTGLFLGLIALWLLTRPAIEPIPATECVRRGAVAQNRA